MVNTGNSQYYTFRVAMEHLSPKPLEAALVSTDGLGLANYPLHPDEEWNEERYILSPMSAVMLSLGERISDNLRTGELRETIVCGTTGITIMLVSDELVLSAKFPIVSSIDDVRSQLRAAMQVINQRNPHGFTFIAAMERLSPRPKKAALVSVDGLETAGYPLNDSTFNEIRREENRSAAMSAAMFSLGERVTEDLRNGILRETVVRGSNGITIMMLVDEDTILATNFVSIPSVEDMRSQLIKTIEEMKRYL